MDSLGCRSVFVISDLHLGEVYSKTPQGRGFRINTHVDDLVQFIQELAQMPADPGIELVINGDMVDFLAEREDAPPYSSAFTYDSAEACAKLQTIAERDAPFFRALGGFLEQKHRL